MQDQSLKRWRSLAAVQTRARQLRKEMTFAEQKLWRLLRHGQLKGTRFRRQHAVGRFIVDFFCPQAKLVIEIDGDTHATRAEYDAERTRWLSEQKRYRVLRFSNAEVHDQTESVLQRIWDALEEGGPHPWPFPRRDRQGKEDAST